MANTKGKIIIGAGIVVIGGTIAYFVSRGIRRKKILDRIYKQLDDVKSAQGASATLDEEEKHKANFGFDANFWQKGKNGIMPNSNLLLPPRIARDRARGIKDAIGYFDEDESAILKEIKKSKSQGQLSQITHAYESGALNFGNLGDDIQDALRGTWYGSKDRLKELNNYINALPY
jgi:hypothetical protein